MTVFFVLTTLVIFLGIDYILQRRKEKAAALAGNALLSPDNIRLPEGLALATNHTWSRVMPDGTRRIGFDELIARLVGTVERIEVPRSGATVMLRGDGVRLRDRNRILRLSSPVAGQVVEVNADVLSDPALPSKDPYGMGWLFAVRPSANTADSAMTGEAALRWLRRQVQLAGEFLTMKSPTLSTVTMHDGGVPVHGILKRFDAAVWEEFQDRFVGAENTSAAREARP